MIKFINTPDKLRPFVDSDFPDLTVEISSEDAVTVEQLGNMLVNFALAIGFSESAVARFSSEYNHCEGCELVENDVVEVEVKSSWPEPNDENKSDEIEGGPV